MSTRLGVGIELLERSLAYTRVALAQVRPTSLTLPTPCTRWDLASLLTHMDDALDAFLEAAAGAVEVDRPAPVPGPAVVGRLQDKACALLGTWASTVHRSASGVVEVGGVAMDAALLVDAAAVEITVHGWDVAATLGLDHPVPDGLATALLPAAVEMAGLGRFAAPVPVPDDAPAEVRLLGALGRVSPWPGPAR